MRRSALTSSLAIAADADAKAVQNMLGHKLATIYGHLFPDPAIEVADAMETACLAALG
jgi:hypothetical protein